MCRRIALVLVFLVVAGDLSLRAASSVFGFPNLLMSAGGYVNFGSIIGTSGYGVRDNSGTMEVKNSGGSWSPIVTGTFSGNIIPATDATYTLGDATHGWLKGFFSGTGDGDGTGGFSLSTQGGPSVDFYPYANGDLEIDAGSSNIYLERNSHVLYLQTINLNAGQIYGSAAVQIFSTKGDVGYVNHFGYAAGSCTFGDPCQEVVQPTAVADATSKYYNAIVRYDAITKAADHTVSIFEEGVEGHLADNGTITDSNWYLWDFKGNYSIAHIVGGSPSFIIDDAVNFLVAGGFATISGTEGGDGLLQVRADQGDDATDTWQIKVPATGNAFQLINNSNAYFSLSTAGAITGPTSLTSTALAFTTTTTCTNTSTPSAPADNSAVVYCDTSGGKDRLMVLFHTGAAQQIAIEP